MKIQMFDPPMCCSTGVCGPSVDPKLVSVAADLAWLQQQGIVVERYNLSQQPAAFVSTAAVKDALASEGNACLPMTLVDGDVLCKGRYPTREMLADFASLGGPHRDLADDAARRLSVREVRADGVGGCCGTSAVSAAQRGRSGCC
jgi:hypothetical protein